VKRQIEQDAIETQAMSPAELGALHAERDRPLDPDDQADAQRQGAVTR